MLITGYRAMWIWVMFDLPVDTRKARREYTLFRKSLLRDGFMQIQYSVYARPCPSQENADVHFGRVRGFLPPGGEVRIMTTTDKQFERMHVYWGRKRGRPEAMPSQLSLF